MPEILTSDSTIAQISCDALVVGAHPRDGGFELTPSGAQADEALGGYISEYLEDISFKATTGQVASVPALQRIQAKTVAIVGLGPKDGLTPRSLRKAAGSAARRLSERAVIATTLHEDQGPDAEAAVAEAFVNATYRFTALKSDPKPAKLQRVLLLGAQEAAVARGAAVGKAMTLARDLINEPAGTLNPEALARRAQEVADVEGLECRVLDEAAMRDKGLNGVLTVAKGSDAPPRFIELAYRPDAPVAKVALVGKGVTFDSGGLSLKDAKGMETMKTDMGGAAAVIGAMSVVKRLGIQAEVTAFIPAVENMPGGNAVKPGDVIHHYGGKTSEVLNTDAEGRLILADALAVAAETEPDAIIDVATLTGSIQIALGRDLFGLFSNDDGLATAVDAAATRAGELAWRMPLHTDYRRQIDSEVADFKNIGTRYGGSIVAALFLSEFVPDGRPWAHLDIAGTARAESDGDEGPKGGTGSATRTLIAWLESYGR